MPDHNDNSRRAISHSNVFSGNNINTTNPKLRPKKYKEKETKYNLFKTKELLGSFTKTQLEDFLFLDWESIRQYLNKDKRISGVYYIKSIKKK